MLPYDRTIEIKLLLKNSVAEANVMIEARGHRSERLVSFLICKALIEVKIS